MHTTVICISEDTTSVMNALAGNEYDYYDEDNSTDQTFDGTRIDEICGVDEFKALSDDALDEVGAVIDNGKWIDVEGCQQVRKVLERHLNTDWAKAYDVHI